MRDWIVERVNLVAGIVAQILKRIGRVVANENPIAANVRELLIKIGTIIRAIDLQLVDTRISRSSIEQAF